MYWTYNIIELYWSIQIWKFDTHLLFVALNSDHVVYTCSLFKVDIDKSQICNMSAKNVWDNPSLNKIHNLRDYNK